MTNYLLSIDPSIKNTGFTLWKNKKPIWLKSYSFEKFQNINPTFDEQIIFELFIIGKIKHFDNMNIIIERGTFHSKNGIGYETQEHLRGFIAGQFNKLITKDMLISPSSWKKWYIKEFPTLFEKDKKWTKEHSLAITEFIRNYNNWNIKISNHDEADSLLIGWYYLNKENK